MITATQCYQARRLLGWSLDELGLFVCIRAVHISRFEAGKLELDAEQRSALRRMFEAAGLVFAEGHPSGRGVCVRPPAPRASLDVPGAGAAQA
ncbi:MAG: transcriptional regulator [Alsobacter sp.]